MVNCNVIANRKDKTTGLLSPGIQPTHLRLHDWYRFSISPCYQCSRSGKKQNKISNVDFQGRQALVGLVLQNLSLYGITLYHDIEINIYIQTETEY